MENKLKILQTIEKAEVNPFLFDKIINKIINRHKEIISIKWGYIAAACLVVIFTINMTLLQESKSRNKPDLTEIFSMKTQNALYHEKK